MRAGELARIYTAVFGQVRKMISRLVLLRHGTPDYKFDGPDLERPLAEAGLRSLKDALPAELSLLEPHRDFQIWTSPAKRACQTAEVLAEVLHQDGDVVVQHDDLYAQDVGLFITELRLSAGTVVAVGHVPFMEQLTEYLTGDRIRFNKGAVASIVFPKQTIEGAVLEWFVQGPDASRWETLITVEKRLAKCAKKIENSLDYLLEHPRETEALHRFRVSIRTARSLVAFIRPFQKRRQNIVIDTLLADLQHSCSFLRELDGLCERIGSFSNGSTENLTFLFVCENARDNERTRLIAYLGRRNTRRQLRETLHEMRNIKWRTEVEAGGLSVVDFRAEFDALYASCREGYETCDFTDDEATHTLRKRIKRLRYVAENFDVLLDDGRKNIVNASRKAQDELGELCDARVDLGIISTFDKRGAFEGAEAERDAYVECTKGRIEEILSSLGSERGEREQAGQEE